jgi:hypothetical protein
MRKAGSRRDSAGNEPTSTSSAAMGAVEHSHRNRAAPKAVELVVTVSRGRTLPVWCRNACICRVRFFPLLLSLAVAYPVWPFDFPLTESSIRDAYFLGIRQGAVSPEILKHYAQGIDQLHQGNCVSEARIETPFLQVAEYVGSVPNYSAQDAVKELSRRSMPVRLYLDLCYMREAPPPNSVKLRFVQNKNVITPESDVRSVYSERFSETSFLLPNGERAKLEFDPKNLGSSTLTVLIDTTDGQHAEVGFDLQTLR